MAVTVQPRPAAGVSAPTQDGRPHCPGTTANNGPNPESESINVKRTQTDQATEPMKRTWLVQRLRKPYGGGPLGPDNPFNFGGGLRNGGLSDDAMSLLRGIFSFDYMGAAEFEFGAVPEALRKLASGADELTAFAISIPLASVPSNWRDSSGDVPDGAAEVFVLCRHGQANEVVARVESWATVEYPRLKETLRFTSALRPFDEWDGEVQGWLELDNGFFFFTDRAMWSQTCDLFGVTTETAEVEA